MMAEQNWIGWYYRRGYTSGRSRYPKQDCKTYRGWAAQKVGSGLEGVERGRRVSLGACKGQRGAL